MKGKILLVDPYFNEGLKGFPLGLSYVAAALSSRHNVRVLDLTARAYVEGVDWKNVLREELALSNLPFRACSKISRI